jgi:uncharacterized membrane protein
VPKFDIGKLAAGGALAAIVMNICDYVSNNFILANDWERVARLRNVDMEVMGGVHALVILVLVDILLGFLVVFAYAAIRPRFGRGPATATVAAFMVFLPQALIVATLVVGGFFSWDVFVRSQALMLVSVLAGALSGAWIYSEPTDEPD